jgi:hypothetical protein
MGGNKTMGHDLEPHTIDEQELVLKIKRRYEVRIWEARGSWLDLFIIAMQLQEAIRYALIERRRLIALSWDKRRQRDHEYENTPQ